METQSIPYTVGATQCIGYLAYEEYLPFKRPVMLIAHTWQGLNGFIKEKARDIARLGYIAFAVDIYGGGIETRSTDEAAQLMMPFFLDRELLRQRIIGAMKHAVTLPQADSERVAAIGFCFGGLTVIELLRSGAPVRCVVCFHGILGDKLGDQKAKLKPNAAHIPGSILVLHGIRDPLVPMEDVIHFQQEMTEADVDWQMHIYSSAGHGFTNPEVFDKSGGMFFDPLTSQRSFQAMQNYFSERLL